MNLILSFIIQCLIFSHFSHRSDSHSPSIRQKLSLTIPTSSIFLHSSHQRILTSAHSPSSKSDKPNPTNHFSTLPSHSNHEIPTLRPRPIPSHQLRPRSARTCTRSSSRLYRIRRCVLCSHTYSATVAGAIADSDRMVRRVSRLRRGDFLFCEFDIRQRWKMDADSES